MPYVVNGQLITKAAIREEEQRICRDLRWNTIPDPVERAMRLRTAAEFSAIERTLVEQAAINDPRPIDANAVEEELQRQKGRGAHWSASQEYEQRQLIERNVRLQRTSQEMGGAPKPSAEEVEAFYNAHRENFHNPELFHAAHIVKHVNAEQGHEQAHAGIKVALMELDNGKPFAEVAECYSDCKGSGGDLGEFTAGAMVREFEEAIRSAYARRYGKTPEIYRVEPSAGAGQVW